MADSYKLKVLREINSVADDPTIADNARQVADILGNEIADMEEEDIKKHLYATLTQPGNARRLILKYLPEEGSEIRGMVLEGRAPQYDEPDRKKIGEMFKDVGGEKVLDQGAPEFFGANPNVDRAKVRAIAKANGMTEAELWKTLQDESVKMQREKIVEGSDVGGWFDSPDAFRSHLAAKVLGITMPRTMGRVKAGQDVRKRDVALDVGENIAYTVNPAQRAVGLGVRGLGRVAPRAAAAIEKGASKGVVNLTPATIGSNVANPALMEAADVVAYGGEEGNERGKFSGVDVGAGTAINLAVPRLLRGKFLTFGQAGSFKNNRKNVLGQIGEGMTFQDALKSVEAAKNARTFALDKAGKRMKQSGAYGTANWQPLAHMTGEERAAFNAFKPASINEKADNTIFELVKVKAENPKLTYDEALQKFIGNMKPTDRFKFYNEYLDHDLFKIDNKANIHATDALATAIEGSSYAPLLSQKFKTRMDIEVPDAILSYGSNKYGDLMDDKRRRAAIGMFSPELAQKLEQREQEGKQERQRRLMQKYILGGTQ